MALKHPRGSMYNRRNEVALSIITPAAVVTEIGIFDDTETSRRKNLKDNDKKYRPYAPKAAATTDAIESLQQYELAFSNVRLKASITSEAGLIRQKPAVWTSINGLTFEPPNFTNVENFKKFPFCIQREYMERKIQFRGLIGTSWSSSSNLGEVKGSTIPIRRAGTFPQYIPYERTIVNSGDILVACLPDPTTFAAQATDVFNRDKGKYLMDLKPVQDLDEEFESAMKWVTDTLVKVSENFDGDKNAGEKFSLMIDNPFEKYISALANLREEDFIKQKVCSAIVVVFSLAQRDDDGYLLPVSALEAQTLKRFQKGLLAMNERNRFVQSRVVGVALTSGRGGQQFDMLLGRGKAT